MRSTEGNAGYVPHASGTCIPYRVPFFAPLPPFVSPLTYIWDEDGYMESVLSFRAATSPLSHALRRFSSQSREADPPDPPLIITCRARHPLRSFRYAFFFLLFCRFFCGIFLVLLEAFCVSVACTVTVTVPSSYVSWNM